MADLRALHPPRSVRRVAYDRAACLQVPLELKEDLEILRSYQSLMRAECANFPALAPEMPSSRALGLRKAALEGLDQW